MSRFWFGFLVIGIASVGYVWNHPDVPGVRELRASVAGAGDNLLRMREDAFTRVRQLARREPEPQDAVVAYGSVTPAPASPATALQVVAPAPILQNAVTVHLHNGGALTGELVSETPTQVTLRWEGGEVGFSPSEIARLERLGQVTGAAEVVLPWQNEHEKARWPHESAQVVKLTRGTIVDAPITAVTGDTVVMTQRLPSGGAIEHTVKRDEVEAVLFRPMDNERSTAIAETLRTLFPDMQWYEEGFVTIITDSVGTPVKQYRQTIRDLVRDWYLMFYPLAKARPPQVQMYVVIFDDWARYIEYAITDGVPGWIAVGYFHPEDQVLYGFNMLGERFSDLLYEGYLGYTREARDQIVAQFKDTQHQETVEGQTSQFLQTLEAGHARARVLFRELTVGVLRHEATHSLFHNWRLQGVMLSQLPEDQAGTVEKKYKFLQSGDQKEKQALLNELLSGKKDAALPEMRAANSWYTEGLAGFMEPEPVGGLNLERLPDAQEAARASRLLPLEFLDAFRIGSFRGMKGDSAAYAYAQSWAFCHFLMHRHPEAFMVYLQRLADAPPREADHALAWLVEATGMEQRALEQQFRDHLAALPPQDPLWLRQQQDLLDLDAEIKAAAQSLWGH